MKNKDFSINQKIIRETFNDLRQIKCPTPKEDTQLDEHVYPGSEIFTTETGEFIDLEFQITDFTEYELVKFVEFAEAMYEKHHKHISIYIICAKDIQVTVKECKIISEADFTIKLAKLSENPAHEILDMIKKKLKYEGRLDSEDIDILAALHVTCNKEDKNYFLREYLRIISKMEY